MVIAVIACFIPAPQPQVIMPDSKLIQHMNASTMVKICNS